MAVTKKLDDIMAPITVAFKQRAAQLIKVGAKGRVLFAVKNAELEADFKVSAFISSLNTGIENEEVKKKVTDIFDGDAKEVILFEYKNALETYVSELDKLTFDWFVCDDEAEQSTVATYCIEREIFCVVYNTPKDNMFIVNFTTPRLVDKEGNIINGIDYLPKIAGVLAGCPYTMSVSYKVFNDLQSVDIPETIKDGELMLYNDEDGIRFASAKNSLVTLGENITTDMQYICIVEGMKRLKTDIKYAFKTTYKGKYKNKYDNQCLLITAVNAYLRELEKIGILDEEYDNNCDVDVKTQREKWIASGKDENEINEMTDQEIRELTYKDMVYLLLDVKFLNAMEGMQATVEMY